MGEHQYRTLEKQRVLPALYTANYLMGAFNELMLERLRQPYLVPANQLTRRGSQPKDFRTVGGSALEAG